MKILLPLFLLLAAEQPYIETFEVRLHNLDVIVTDSRGHTVSGLTKDDFIVLEDGKAQEVTNFAAYAESSGATSAAPTPPPAPARAQEAEEAPQPQPRRFIFFIDEMALHPMSRAKILKNATALIESAMHEGDLATVLRPGGETSLPFTTDRNAVIAALKKAIEATPSELKTQSFAELLFFRQQLSYSSTRQEAYVARKQYADMVRRRVEQRLGVLHAVIGSLAGVDGRKVLVLMTTSLSAQPGAEAFDIEEQTPHEQSENNPEVAQGLNPKYKDMRPEFDELARTAAANGITIYPLQPDVPLELAIGEQGGADYRPRAARRVTTPQFLYPQILRNTETTLVTLAEKTGGRWFRGDGAIDDAFRQVGADLSSYYSLAYRAHGDQATRHVEVRIRNHPDYRVRTRTDVIERSTEKEMEDQVVASLFYPREVNELGIRSITGPITKARNLFTVPVETLVPMEKLTFLPTADGKYHATFTIHYAAAGEKADFTTGQEREQEITITEEQYKALAGKLFHYDSNLVVAPGKVRIAVGVLDRASRLTGFSRVAVEAR